MRGGVPAGDPPRQALAMAPARAPVAEVPLPDATPGSREARACGVCGLIGAGVPPPVCPACGAGRG